MSVSSPLRTGLLALLVIAPTLVVAACALSGQEGRVYSAPSVVSQDPDTLPLPSASHAKMNDPLIPPAASAPAAVASQPPPEEDAGAVASAAEAGAPIAAGTAKPAAPPPSDCDGKAKPCPMQLFMRGTMSSAKTPEQLAAVFARAANMSPNGGWAWRAISQKGVELAKGGDAAGAKKQCGACHGQYKEPYKAQYRARKI